MQKVCEICGKEFETNRLRQKTCSFNCRKIYKHQRYLENYKPVKKEPLNLPNRHCRFCDKEFTPEIIQQVFCSKDCRKAFGTSPAQQIIKFRQMATAKGLWWDGTC